MSTIDALYQDCLKLDLKGEIPQLIVDNGAEAGHLVETQLAQGQLSTGASITPEYANTYYSRKKESMNSTPGYGVPDLKYSGDYYKSIGVALKSEQEYVIESDVPYANDPQITQYGEDLLKLSDDNLTIFAEKTLLPAIGKYIKEITGLELSGE